MKGVKRLVDVCESGSFSVKFGKGKNNGCKTLSSTPFTLEVGSRCLVANSDVTVYCF